MAQFYFRTEEEFIQDDLLCAEPCEHRDCACTRRELASACRYCDKTVAGRACFYEDSGLVHVTCAMKEVS